jgi:hypothetical protein
MLSENTAKQTVEMFLFNLRRMVSQNNLDLSRLPPWVTAARIRVGWINDSLVCAFEDVLSQDIYEIRGSVKADTVVLLNIGDFIPEAASLAARKDTTGIIILEGTYGDKKRTIFDLIDKTPAFFNCGYDGYHGPIGLLNIFMQHCPSGAGTGPVAVRYIPFALYVHENDTADSNRLWNSCQQHLINVLTRIHNTQTGDFYARLKSRGTTFALNKLSGVIVLGKDTGAELHELIQIRDYLKGIGYDAELIKDLPEIPMMSNEEKVRLWCLVSRFVIMVDRSPAGHLAEYVTLREQRTILALLRPRGHGSTYMIGDDQLVDSNAVRLFEFDETPLKTLDPVKKWAEMTVQKRTSQYNKAYPWRDHQRV